ANKITRILSSIIGIMANKTNRNKEGNGKMTNRIVERTFKKSVIWCIHSTRNKTRDGLIIFFFFKQKTAYDIGLGIPAEPLFRSRNRLLVIIMVANKYAFLQITRRRFLNEWEVFKKVISRRNIRRRITIPLTLSNLKLLRRITRTENILHRNFTRRQVAIQNRVASNIGISQSTFSVKVLNLFSRSRRKTNKRKSKHSAMLRNKETRHRMFIGLLNTTRKL